MSHDDIKPQDNYLIVHAYLQGVKNYDGIIKFVYLVFDLTIQ